MTGIPPSYRPPDLYALLSQPVPELADATIRTTVTATIETTDERGGTALLGNLW